MLRRVLFVFVGLLVIQAGIVVARGELRTSDVDTVLVYCAVFGGFFVFVRVRAIWLGSRDKSARGDGRSREPED